MGHELCKGMRPVPTKQNSHAQTEDPYSTFRRTPRHFPSKWLLWTSNHSTPQERRIRRHFNHRRPRLHESERGSFLPCSTTITGEGGSEAVPWKTSTGGLGCPLKSSRTETPCCHLPLLAKALCEKLQIKQNISTAFHPQTDGLSERKNQWIEQFLRLTH